MEMFPVGKPALAQKASEWLREFLTTWIRLSFVKTAARKRFHNQWKGLTKKRGSW